MGASASRIWSNICEIDSDTVRIGVIRKILSDPAYVELATSAGVYTTVVEWVMQMQHGIVMPFPYRRTPSPSHTSLPAGSDSMRYAHLYSAPTGAGGRPVISHDSGGGGGGGGRGTAIIESPAAKAMDYFQEAMALLGIDESEDLTHERVRAAYKRESLRAHPDKGGSKEEFDELRKAYQYIGKILDRVKPRPDERMTTAVTLETATAARKASAPAAPVRLSAKKLDMTTFNRLFEENRLPDPSVDGGYGDWMAQENARRDEEPAKQMSKAAWEEAFRKKAIRQGREGAAALTKRLEPDAIISPHGTELGGEVRNFTAAFGADNQFTDLKEAYTSGATVMHEVAGVRVVERSATSVQEAQRIREAEMARVDPDESARFEAAAAAVADRERQRRLRLAQQDITMDTWADRMRGRLAVTDA